MFQILLLLQKRLLGLLSKQIVKHKSLFVAFLYFLTYKSLFRAFSILIVLNTIVLLVIL